MTSRLVPACLLAPVLAILGCSGDPMETTSRSSSAIIGGQVDDEDGPVVWIVGDLEGRLGYCSGVVVSPHVVLTAGHCAGAKAKFKIFLGANYDDEAAKAAPESYIEVTSNRASPDYDSRRNLHDVGVLVTKDAIPRTPATINRDPLRKDDVGQPLRIAGFGRTEAADDTTIGRRHEATTVLDGFDDTSLGMKEKPSFCLFDSGGPTFMTREGKEVVVGIHSIVEEITCDGVAWDARVDIDAAFIDGVIAKADPPPETTTVEEPTEPAEPADRPPPSATSGEPATQTSSCSLGAAPRPSGGGTTGNGAAGALVALAATLALRARYSRARHARRDRSRLERR